MKTAMPNISSNNQRFTPSPGSNHHNSLRHAAFGVAPVCRFIVNIILVVQAVSTFFCSDPVLGIELGLAHEGPESPGLWAFTVGQGKRALHSGSLLDFGYHTTGCPELLKAIIGTRFSFK